MRKIISLLLVFVMVFSLGIALVNAAEVTGAYEEEEISPRILHHYEKTITKYYADHKEVPYIYFYEEYNSTLQTWFSGNLYLTDIHITSNGCIATFTGDIYGYI